MREQVETETLESLGESGFNTDVEPPPLNPNIPLTGADLKAARRRLYEAALMTLNGIPVTGENRAAIEALRGQFQAEREEAHIFDTTSLLPMLMAGQKEVLKRIVSRDLLDTLAERIAQATGQGAGSVAHHAHTNFTTLINTSDKWRPFAKSLDIGGSEYTSQFTPINQAFDPTFAGYGHSGYASLAAHLPLDKATPVDSRARTTNAWHTQFRSCDSAIGDVLFSAFRTGSFGEPGIQDSETRQRVARAKAYDLLKAMVVEYLKARPPDEQQAILSGGRAPTLTVVSSSLLTSFLGKLDHKLLKDHAHAFEWYHGKKTSFDISFGGNTRPVMVSLNIINFNKAVNEFRWMGASRSGQQLGMNAQAIKRLKTFKEEGLALLEQKRLNNEGKLAGRQAMDDGEEAETLQAQNDKLDVQIAKIRALWARIETISNRRWRLYSGSGSGYELPALVSNLGYQLGAMVHYNCLSGKDRTGMADVEAKLLAYQMDRRVREAQESGLPLDQPQLVPNYSGGFTDDDAQAAVNLMFEGGNLDIQQFNTGVAGFKIRGAMESRFGGGRLGRILSTEKGQKALRKYMNMDDTISIKAKGFTKLLNALSIFTGA